MRNCATTEGAVCLQSRIIAASQVRKRGMATEEELREIRRREAIINARLQELLTTGRIAGEDPEITSRESYTGRPFDSEAPGRN
jgi:hypothetical protein